MKTSCTKMQFWFFNNYNKSLLIINNIKQTHNLHQQNFSKIIVLQKTLSKHFLYNKDFVLSPLKLVNPFKCQSMTICPLT